MNLKRFFPVKPASIDGFINEMKMRGATQVQAHPVIVRKGGIMTGAVGMIADSHYTVEYRATPPGGRPIVLEETYARRISSDWGPDVAGSEAYAIRMFLTAEKRLEYIKERLPDVKTVLLTKKGPMDHETYEELRQKEISYGVGPFELNDHTGACTRRLD